jgi:two-component system response regulator HydG
MDFGQRGTPLALLVDDEPSIRQFASIVLQREGFGTLSACGTATALRLAKRTPGRIDMLVTDVQLGDGDGIEMANAIRRERPGIPVLVISGVLYNEPRAEALGYRFLAKPFTPAKLVECVRALLRADAAGAGQAGPALPLRRAG